MKEVFCIVFVFAQTAIFGQEPIKPKMVTPGKEVASVDVSRTTQKVMITYRDKTSEELTEKEANDLGYVHNGGYANFKQEATKRAKPGFRNLRDTARPLIILNGKEYPGKPDDIDPNTIESINVLKNVVAKAKYGEKGKSGVIEIKLKPSAAASFTNADEWQGKKIYQLLGASESDEIIGFELSVQDENEDVSVTRQRGAGFNEAGQKALAKAREGSPVIFEKIRVKRAGKEILLPTRSYTR